MGPGTIRQVWGDPTLLGWGLAFSVPTLLILLAHELGHFLTCRRYGIPATWPWTFDRFREEMAAPKPEAYDRV